MIIKRLLYLTNDSDPKIEICITDIVQSLEDNFFECHYFIKQLLKNEKIKDKGVGVDSLQALIQAINQIGIAIEAINDGSFNGKLRQHPSEIDMSLSNCGLPYFDSHLQKFVF